MPHITERLDTRTLPGSTGVLRAREKAYRRLQETGFPTKRHEDWKYTDIRPILDGDFARPAEDGKETALQAAGALSRVAVDGPRLVFVDGVYSEELSDTSGIANVSIESLADCWPALDERFGGPGGFDGHPLALLNTAAVEHGAVVRLAENAEAEAPLTLLYVATADSATAAHSRVIVDLAERARLALVQQFVDVSAKPGWLNLVTQIRQAQGSDLALYSLQQHAQEQFHTALVHNTLGEAARFGAAFVDTGGRIVRRDVDIRLEGADSHTELRGVFLANENQHVDDHIRIDHIAPATSSLTAFKGIVGKGGRGVFNGKVIVHEGAQGTDARQRSDNLLLDESAEVDTKPELEIYADEVKCSHGATVGELDERQLFYLRSRGVDEPAARALLTFAFANSSIEEVGLPAFRDAAAALVAARLPAHELWERLA